MSIRKLCNQELPLKNAYQLNLLINKLNPHLSYFDNNRERIAELADNNDAELLALLDEEVDIEFEPIEIKLSTDIQLSVLDLLQLEGFIKISE